MLKTKIRTILAALVFTAFTAGAATSRAEEVKLPQTAADHEALAKQYKEEAVQYRKVVTEHQEMAAAYAKAHPDSKAGKNPWNVKMQKHCEALAKDAEKLAVDADKAADYHTNRAKELQGK
ncbi:MAG TPA: hypothetical protein VHB68_09270 [Steroidobacteraceae bacterium]|nr:hypothetical protein [Steroidobacteraceae bacterium]